VGGTISQEVLSAILEKEAASHNRSDRTGGISAWDGDNNNLRIPSGLDLNSVHQYSTQFSVKNDDPYRKF